MKQTIQMTLSPSVNCYTMHTSNKGRIDKIVIVNKLTTENAMRAFAFLLITQPRMPFYARSKIHLF